MSNILETTESAYYPAFKRMNRNVTLGKNTDSKAAIKTLINKFVILIKLKWLFHFRSKRSEGYRSTSVTFDSHVGSFVSE